MISLVIGLLLSAAIVKIYVDTSQIYKFQNAVSEVQENGRFASAFLRRAARLAGNFGCVNGQDVASTPVMPPAHLGFVTGAKAQPIGGSEGGGVAGVNGENSDELILRGSTGGGVRLDANRTGEDTALTVETNSGLTKDSFAVISDCNTTHIFEITGVAGRTITHAGIAQDYTTGKGARVQEVEAITYCIGRATAWTDANRLMALKRLINPGAGDNCPDVGVGEELVEGIQNLQVLYGEDLAVLDGFANRYVTAPAEMTNVKTLRIELLVRSLANAVTSTAVPPTLAGAAIPLAANDRYLYKVMTNTITLRNSCDPNC